MDPRSLIGPEDEQKQTEKHESGGGLNNNKPLHHSACSAVLQSATRVMRDSCCCKDETAVHCRGAGPAVSISIWTNSDKDEIWITHSGPLPSSSSCTASRGGQHAVYVVRQESGGSLIAAPHPHMQHRGGQHAVLGECRGREDRALHTATSQVGRRVHSSSCY
jgi:hypothetical protein